METTTPENEAPTLMNHAIRFGVILGAISIALVVIFYVVDFTMMAGFKFMGLLLILGLGVVIYAGINYRNEIGGYLPYGKAFVHGFVILAVSGLLTTAFNIVLYQVVDPELGQKMTDAVILNTENMLAGFGVPQSSIDQAVEGMRAEMPEQFTVVGLCFGYLKALIWYAVIVVITSLFVRKNVPVEL